MKVEQQILQRLKGYTKAFYQQNYDALAGYFYPEEIQTFRESLEWIAKAMLPFGEAEGFMRMFKGVSPDDLSKLSDQEFMRMFFSGAAAALSPDSVKQLVESIQIEEIDHADYIANVQYSFVNFSFGEEFRVQSEVNLILSEGEWYLLFRTQMTDTFTRMREKIEEYHEAKKKDNISLSNTPDDEIEVFSLYGFRTYDEDTIIHPRFKAAGDFKNGLAPVKMFNLWGYINKRGDYVIQPQYNRAEEFQEGVAVVAVFNDDLEMTYGYINRKGQQIVELMFDDARSFSEGLAAVRKGTFWGYINKKGEIVIPLIYEAAFDFSDGTASVEKDGDYYVIDFEGNIVESLDDDDDFWDEDDDDDFF